MAATAWTRISGSAWSRGVSDMASLDPIRRRLSLTRAAVERRAP
jgi:hypothetical protein